MTSQTKTMGRIAMNAFSETYTEARRKAEEAEAAGDKTAMLKPIEYWTLLAHEGAANAVLEEVARIADYWGSGSWKFQDNGRKRFDSFDCQNIVNTTSRAIAEDIRKLKSMPPMDKTSDDQSNHPEPQNQMP